MYRLLSIITIFSLVAFAVPADAAPDSIVIPGAYIVRLKDGASATSILSASNILAERKFSHALNGFAGKLSDLQLKMLQNDPRVLSIEPDVEVTAFPVRSQFTFPSFPSFPFKRSSSSSSTSSQSSTSSSVVSSPQSSSSSSSSLQSSQSSTSSTVTSSASPSSSASTQVLPTGINRVEADLNSISAIDTMEQMVDVDIAVIDTGAQKTHPDLNVFRQANFTRESSADDGNGHGTHVAGSAAAKDNGFGVVGVAPGARVWSVKVLDRRGSGYMSDIISGVDYVVAHADEIEVANMSLGCNCVSQALDDAINRAVDAGVVMVVAAGNSAKDATTFSPANHAKVISVSAIADFNGLPGGGAPYTCSSDVDDTFANFSNYGSPVDIAAPGVCIYSTWKGSSYSTISGTSMASPHVAGAVALYLSHNTKPANAVDVAAVKQVIIDAAFDQGSVNGFTGDPDSSKEKLLNVAGL